MPDFADTQSDNVAQELHLRTEAKRQMALFALFTAVVGPLQFVYGVYDIWYGSVALGAFELLTVAVSVGSYWLARRGKVHLEAAKTVFSAINLLQVVTSLPSGGVDGTAIYWVFVFAPAAYLLNGMVVGTVLNAMMVLSLAALSGAQQAGLISTAYTGGEYLQAMTSVFILSLLGFSGERTSRDFRHTVVAQGEELRVLMANMPVGVIMFDVRTGAVAASNSAAARLLGRELGDGIRLTSFAESCALTSENGAPLTSAAFPASIALESHARTSPVSVFVARPDGSRATLRVAAAPVMDGHGHVVAVVTVIDDMTKEYEVARMQSEFASFANHQLKAPLTSIRWSLESLLDGGSGPLTPAQETEIQTMTGTVQRLSDLVHDMLSVSKMEDAAHDFLERKRTDLRPLLSAAIRDLRTAASKRDVTIEEKDLPESIVRHADGMRIREVFANLIGNAIKYSHRGGTVTVGYDHGTPYGDAIYVRDRGLGIPKRQQPKIFERFFRGGNVTEVEGTGLGLYIARQIVERHGGRIWFESTEGSGTVFYVALPESAK